MKRIVVLTGAGISAESGIQTFRDGDGLWNKYRFEELASPAAWARDPELVLNFYNWRRKIVWDAQPNEGHKALLRLEKKFDVQIITQNVDDLQIGHTTDVEGFWVNIILLLEGINVYNEAGSGVNDHGGPDHNKNIGL